MRPEGLSHIMHNLGGGKRRKKKNKERKPLYTSKEIKSRVKSNSRGIVKEGSGGGGGGVGGGAHHASAPDKICECDTSGSFCCMLSPPATLCA